MPTGGFAGARGGCDCCAATMLKAVATNTHAIVRDVLDTTGSRQNWLPECTTSPAVGFRDGAVWFHAGATRRMLENFRLSPRSSMASFLNKSAHSFPYGRCCVTMPKADDWVIERWRTEPRFVKLEFDDAPLETAPPLWKDLTLASAIALLLWGAAAIVFG